MEESNTKGKLLSEKLEIEKIAIKSEINSPKNKVCKKKFLFCFMFKDFKI